MTVSLRRAAAGDAPAVAVLFRRVRREALPYLPDLHDAAEDLAFFRGVLGASEVWLAEEGGRLVGFAAARPGWLDHLYVAAPARGRGVGGALLERATRGQARVRLWVFQRNRAAIAFYERHGFRRALETDGARNEEREPDALYVRGGAPGPDAGGAATVEGAAGGPGRRPDERGGRSPGA